jgi:hypothetical protein
MTAVIIAAPGPVFLDPNQQTVQINQTVTTSGSGASTLVGYGVQQVNLIVNISGSVTGTTPVITYTIQEVDPGNNTTTMGNSASTVAISAAGVYTASLTTTTSGIVKVSWVVTGTTPSFGGVYSTVVSKTTPATQLATISQGGNSASVTAKGTQGANALTTQNILDSGRVSFVAVASAVTGVTTEALVSLTPVRTVTAGAAATTLTVTAGKTLRIQSLVLTIRNTTTTQAGAIIRVRMNNTTVTATSQEFFAVGATTVGAIAGYASSSSFDMPNEFEISGTTQFGISQLCSSASCTLDIMLCGFEY